MGSTDNEAIKELYMNKMVEKILKYDMGKMKVTERLETVKLAVNFLNASRDYGMLETVILKYNEDMSVMLEEKLFDEEEAAKLAYNIASQESQENGDLELSEDDRKELESLEELTNTLKEELKEDVQGATGVQQVVKPKVTSRVTRRP